KQYPNVCNINFEAKEYKDNIYFMHKAVTGAAKKYYGIQVAKLAGISQDVLESAKQNIYNLEKKQQQTESTQVKDQIQLETTTQNQLQQ
ncbi:DNA mismatch repair protein MutS, partial [Francisella tularensis subsp. holarctica]|uniref:MutS-related protein n=1 Tax=Francisella tularensis TaxID=263 RepID=UPI0023AE128A|nr:DNA mismatch repair protein MutS [Francisella tularensis subsp. holarctica]